MILSIYEKKKLDRLKEKDIVIEEIYIYPNNCNKRLVRASDGKMNDKIVNNILREKRYFYKNENIKNETKFNSQLTYTIIDYNDENEIIECPNCGNKDKIINMIDGCLFCYTNFNYGINNQKTMKKEKVIDIFFSPMYKYVIIIVFILAFIKTIIDVLITRNFGEVALTLVMNLMSIYIFINFIYILINRISNLKNSIPIDSTNQKEFIDFVEYENNVSKNLYIELISNFFDEEKDLIDFDILRVNYLKRNSDEAIINLILRKVYFQSEKIISKKGLYKVTMVKNQKYKKISDNEVLECLGCGASIDITMKKCEYCNKINNIKNEWILKKIEKL